LASLWNMRIDKKYKRPSKYTLDFHQIYLKYAVSKKNYFMKKTIFITLFLISFSSAIFANEGIVWKLDMTGQSKICQSLVKIKGNTFRYYNFFEDTYFYQNGSLLKGNARWNKTKGKIKNNNKVGLNNTYYNLTGMKLGNTITIDKIRRKSAEIDGTKREKFIKNNCKIMKHQLKIVGVLNLLKFLKIKITLLFVLILMIIKNG